VNGDTPRIAVQRSACSARREMLRRRRAGPGAPDRPRPVGCGPQTRIV